MADDETLVPLSEVQGLALSAVRPLEAVSVSLQDALGCVAASDVIAPEDVPPFANSAMDGYAVRAGDTANAPLELDVVGVLPAGAAPTIDVGPGQAIQIMTGAPVPAGADGIAIVERTEPGSGPGRIKILDTVASGSHIRDAGSDIRAGSVVVTAGTLLNPGHLGVLASVGAGKVLVHRRPRVGVMTTGDELVEFGPDGSTIPLKPGQIRDSNRHALIATLRRDGFEPVDYGVVRDSAEAVSDALVRAIGECDAVLSTGGVSMGDFDFVKVVLANWHDSTWLPPDGEDTRALVHELKVAIKPAKPLVIGFLPGRGRNENKRIPMFGLPGNPVSSLVSYQTIALPALRVLSGLPAAPPPITPGLASESFRRRTDGKTHLQRVVATWREDGRLGVRSAGGQQSHQLSAMAEGNALAVIPDGPGIAAGENVDLIIFGPIS